MSKNIDQVFTANPITSNAGTDLMYFGQSPYGAGNDAAMLFSNFKAQFGTPFTPAALTEVNDTNVTLTLGGTPATSLLQAVSITAGWSGTLSGTRGGTGVNNGASTITIGGNFAMSGAFTFAGTLTAATAVTFPTSGTLATTSQLPTPAALTQANDTNVTLTLGGTPATALLQATSITAGWTGTLSGTRGGTGVNNGASTITLGGSLTLSGAFTTTFTVTGTTSVTLPTSGTLATTAQITTNVNQNSASATLAANSRYITNDGASLVTYTLPTTATIGDTYIIVGGSSGGWKIAQNASQTINLGSSTTTSGVGGSLASSNAHDCVTLTCNTTNNGFTAYAVQGNITVV